MNEYPRPTSHPDMHADQEMPEYRLEECEMIASEIDDILATSVRSAGDVHSTNSVSESGISLFRSYRFLNADLNGWAWPLTEKVVDVRYTQSKQPVTTETYEVMVGTIVHQQGITPDPIVARYEISYSGNQRSLIAATVTSPDVLGEADGISTERDMCAYDRSQLFDEIDALGKFHDAQLHEDANLNIA